MSSASALALPPLPLALVSVPPTVTTPVTWTALADADAPGAGVLVVDELAGAGTVGAVTPGPVTPANAMVVGNDSIGVSARTRAARRTVLCIGQPLPFGRTRRATDP